MANELRSALRMKTVFLTALLLGSGGVASADPRWVTGYYASYSETQPGVSMAPTDVDYSILTHVIHWPVVPLANGTFDPNAYGLTAAQSASLVAAAHAAGAKAILGFGGDVATVGDGWRGATAPGVRAAFVAAIVNLMQARGYDGVDINWEGLDSGDPVDQAQFPAFIQQLRTALDQIAPRPLLTMAPTTGWGAPATLVAQVAASLDQVNLQTYVMSGPYPGWVTWFNSPLFNGGFTFPSTGGPVPSADAEVTRFQTAGIPLARLGIGIQFDGAVWSGGSGTSTGGASQPRQTWTYGDGQATDPGAPSMEFVRAAAILSTYTLANGYVRTFDAVARVAWLGRDLAGSADDRFVSFDDQQSIQEKSTYVEGKGLGGIFVFELSGDFFPGAQGDARHPLLAALRSQAPPPTQVLTVTKTGTGSGTVTSDPAGISCGGTCSASFTSGTVVTLSAAASAGSTFAGWSGEGCSGTGTCGVTLTQARNVTATFSSSPVNACVPSATALCIDGKVNGDKRFRIEVDWSTVQGGGQSGKGKAVATAPIGFAKGGIFWFFDATNPEMLVKVLNGCSINSKFWVFASAGTNVGMTVKVTDTTTGLVKSYVNADLTAALPVQDVTAFSCN